MAENVDPKTMLAEHIGEDAAEQLLTRIMEMVQSGASVNEIGQEVKKGFETHAPEKMHEEGCGTATATGAAVGSALGTAAGNAISK